MDQTLHRVLQVLGSWETFQSHTSRTEVEFGPFFSRKYDVSWTRGWEPSACKGATLFCSSDQLAYQQSERSREVCPTKLSPVFKKALRSLCTGHIHDPKLRWRVWAPSKASGPCVLQRCTERHLRTCVQTLRRVKGILVNLSTSGTGAAGDVAILTSRVRRADKRGKQALPSLMSKNI